jgi:hypothetical protein
MKSIEFFKNQTIIFTTPENSFGSSCKEAIEFFNTHDLETCILIFDTNYWLTVNNDSTLLALALDYAEWKTKETNK